MREIKFRAWNKEKKVMVGSFAHIGKGGRMYTIHHEGEEPEYEIMQYTGLKDKNGKEVYEGDIVMFAETEEGTAGLGLVEWDVAEARFFVHTKTNITDLWQGFECFMDEDNGVYDSDVYNIRVIGNIYENPELLDKLSSKNNGEV